MTESHERDGAARDLDAVCRVYGQVRKDVPPPGVDAAVLAQARQAVAPPRRRLGWWVPVSVAASAVLAVTLVMRVQHDADFVPAPLDERTATPSRPVATEAAGEPARSDTESPAPAAAARESAQASSATSQSGAAERHRSAEADAAKAPFAAAPAPPQPSAAPMARSRADGPATVGVAGPAEALPPPEAWLERIERLEAAGRVAEAETERAALEAAYPGWLAGRLGDSQ